MRSSRRGNLLLRNPLARGECAVRILFYLNISLTDISVSDILDISDTDIWGSMA